MPKSCILHGYAAASLYAFGHTQGQVLGASKVQHWTSLLMHAGLIFSEDSTLYMIYMEGQRLKRTVILHMSMFAAVNNQNCQGQRPKKIQGSKLDITVRQIK